MDGADDSQRARAKRALSASPALVSLRRRQLLTLTQALHFNAPPAAGQKDPPGAPLSGRSSDLGPMVQTYFLGDFLERRFWVQHNYLTDVGVSPANSSPPVVLLGPTVAVGATGVTFWSPSKLMFVRVRERSSSSIGGDEERRFALSYASRHSSLSYTPRRPAPEFPLR